MSRIFGTNGDPDADRYKGTFSILGEVFAARATKGLGPNTTYQVLPRFGPPPQRKYINEYWTNPDMGVYNAPRIKRRDHTWTNFMVTHLAVRVMPMLYGRYNPDQETEAMDRLIENGSNLVHREGVGPNAKYYVILVLKGSIVAQVHNFLIGRPSTIDRWDVNEIMSYTREINKRPILWFKDVGFQNRSDASRELQLASRGGVNLSYGNTSFGILGFLDDLANGARLLGEQNVASRLAYHTQSYQPFDR